MIVAACERWGAVVESWIEADYSAVAFVRLADGTAAVAKQAPDTIDSRQDGEALAAWQGRGAARLLELTADRVLLVERVRPGTPTTDDAVVGAALSRLWIEPPAGVEWRRFDVALVGWRASIERWRERLGLEVAASALTALDQVDLGEGSWRLLHGDGHHGNVLDGGDRGWLAIDPQPLVGPPGYDLATALWNGPDDGARPDERIAELAGAAGVEPAELRRWVRFRSALSAAWFLDDGEPFEKAARSLAVARALIP